MSAARRERQGTPPLESPANLCDVGLAHRLDASSSHSVIAPRATETSVIVEVPHAGLVVDAECLATLQAPGRAVARDADLYVDELAASAPDSGATLLVVHTSRYFVDLNRSEDEHDGSAVEGSTGPDAPHGVVWHRTTEGERVLSQPISRQELDRRLRVAHRPYHATLARLLAEKRSRFGHAILVCAHSMPSVGHGFGGREVQRADIVPGTRGRTSASPHVIGLVDRLAEAGGFTVRHDDPYRGGYATAHYGRPRDGVHAVQIEVARRLYMNERTLARVASGVERLRAFYRELTAVLGELELPTPPSS